MASNCGTKRPDRCECHLCLVSLASFMVSLSMMVYLFLSAFICVCFFFCNSFFSNHVSGWGSGYGSLLCVMGHIDVALLIRRCLRCQLLSARMRIYIIRCGLPMLLGQLYAGQLLSGLVFLLTRGLVLLFLYALFFSNTNHLSPFSVFSSCLSYKF